MKANKYINILCISTFMVLGFNEVANAAISNEDMMKNSYIQQYRPVFASLVATRTQTCGSDAKNIPDTGSIWPVLENAAENKYNPYVLSKSFLGYSNKGSSVIQLRGNFEEEWGSINFGAPIPLKSGTYDIEATNRAGKFKASVTIEEETMDIGISESGATRFTTKYKPEKVFIVTIDSFTMLINVLMKNLFLMTQNYK